MLIIYPEQQTSGTPENTFEIDWRVWAVAWAYDETVRLYGDMLRGLAEGPEK